jgi:hypothetical protein
MGMFDYVIMRCPKCNAKIEEQSKAGPCDLKTFTIPGNAPLSVLADMVEDSNRGSLYCRSCSTRLELVVQHMALLREKEPNKLDEEDED